MTELYYTAPSDEVFDEVKKGVLKVFKSLEGKDSLYYKEKESEIKNIGNVKDNMMYLIARLSGNNVKKLVKKLTPKTKEEVYKRLEEAGAYETIYFK